MLDSILSGLFRRSPQKDQGNRLSQAEYQSIIAKAISPVDPREELIISNNFQESTLVIQPEEIPTATQVKVITPNKEADQWLAICDKKADYLAHYSEVIQSPNQKTSKLVKNTATYKDLLVDDNFAVAAHPKQEYIEPGYRKTAGEQMPDKIGGDSDSIDFNQPIEKERFISFGMKRPPRADNTNHPQAPSAPAAPQEASKILPRGLNKDIQQIERDVPRTFQFFGPHYFNQGVAEAHNYHEGRVPVDGKIPLGNFESKRLLQQALRNILIAYSRYDRSIGYVQGMNLLVGSILFHTGGDEVSTFWIFVSLIEDYEMRQIFQKGLPGLDSHGEVMQELLDIYLPETSAIMKKFDIQYILYFSDWIFSLFSKQIPIELMGTLISKFLKEGWPFFYKVCLSFFCLLEDEIHTTARRDDMLVVSDLISIIKLQVPDDETEPANLTALHPPPSAMIDNQAAPRVFTMRRVSDDDEMSVEQATKQRQRKLRLSSSFRQMPQAAVVQEEMKEEMEGQSEHSSFWTGENFTNVGSEEEKEGVKPMLQTVKPQFTSGMVAIKIQDQNEGERIFPEDGSTKIKLKVQDFQHSPMATWRYVLAFADQYWVKSKKKASRQQPSTFIDPKLINSLLQQKYNDARHRYQDQNSYMVPLNTSMLPGGKSQVFLNRSLYKPHQDDSPDFDPQTSREELETSKALLQREQIEFEKKKMEQEERMNRVSSQHYPAGSEGMRNSAEAGMQSMQAIQLISTSMKYPHERHKTPVPYRPAFMEQQVMVKTPTHQPNKMGLYQKQKTLGQIIEDSESVLIAEQAKGRSQIQAGVWVSGRGQVSPDLMRRSMRINTNLQFGRATPENYLEDKSSLICFDVASGGRQSLAYQPLPNQDPNDPDFQQRQTMSPDGDDAAVELYMEKLGERIGRAAMHERQLSNPLPLIPSAHFEEEKKSGTFGKHNKPGNWPPPEEPGLPNIEASLNEPTSKSCSVTKTEIVKITNSMFMKQKNQLEANRKKFLKEGSSSKNSNQKPASEKKSYSEEAKSHEMAVILSNDPTGIQNDNTPKEVTEEDISAAEVRIFNEGYTINQKHREASLEKRRRQQQPISVLSARFNNEFQTSAMGKHSRASREATPNRVGTALFQTSKFVGSPREDDQTINGFENFEIDEDEELEKSSTPKEIDQQSNSSDTPRIVDLSHPRETHHHQALQQADAPLNLNDLNKVVIQQPPSKAQHQEPSMLSINSEVGVQSAKHSKYLAALNNTNIVVDDSTIIEGRLSASTNMINLSMMNQLGAVPMGQQNKNDISMESKKLNLSYIRSQRGKGLKKKQKFGSIQSSGGTMQRKWGYFNDSERDMSRLQEDSKIHSPPRKVARPKLLPFQMLLQNDSQNDQISEHQEAEVEQRPTVRITQISIIEDQEPIPHEEEKESVKNKDEPSPSHQHLHGALQQQEGGVKEEPVNTDHPERRMLESPTSLKHIQTVQPTEFFLEPLKQTPSSQRSRESSPVSPPGNLMEEEEEKEIPSKLQLSVNVDCSPPRRRPNPIDKSPDNSMIKNSILNSSYSETLQSHKITAYKNQFKQKGKITIKIYGPQSPINLNLSETALSLTENKSVAKAGGIIGKEDLALKVELTLSEKSQKEEEEKKAPIIGAHQGDDFIQHHPSLSGSQPHLLENQDQSRSDDVHKQYMDQSHQLLLVNSSRTSEKNCPIAPMSRKSVGNQSLEVLMNRSKLIQSPVSTFSGGRQNEEFRFLQEIQDEEEQQRVEEYPQEHLEPEVLSNNQPQHQKSNSFLEGNIGATSEKSFSSQPERNSSIDFPESMSSGDTNKVLDQIDSQIHQELGHQSMKMGAPSILLKTSSQPSDFFHTNQPFQERMDGPTGFDSGEDGHIQLKKIPFQLVSKGQQQSKEQEELERKYQSFQEQLKKNTIAAPISNNSPSAPEEEEPLSYLETINESSNEYEEDTRSPN